MFCAPGLIFGDIEGVGSHFLILRSRTSFQRYRGRRVPFSCFALSDSFSTVSRASGPVFMFCAPRLIFTGTRESAPVFLVLRARTHFWRYRGRRVPFSSFAISYSFSTVLRASCCVFMSCAPGLIFDVTEGVKSCFHVLRARTRFPRYRGRHVPFSSFALPD
jgi:hypothetical protein